MMVDVDNNHRNHVLKVFNQKRKDFQTTVEYDSYLEKIEDIIEKLNCSDTSDQEKNKIW